MKLLARASAICLLLAVVVRAEPQASQPAAKTLSYEVVDVDGRVHVGPESDASLNFNGPGWFTPKKGDRLGAGLQIRVPLRGRIKLSAVPADPPTVILIESASNVGISELAMKNGAATSRIKLAYGAIRAGVVESGTRSDMEIEAPTATLSKKGTDIFRFEFHDNRFTMSLTEQGRGKLMAMQTQAGNSGVPRFVTAGQFVTQNLIRAIDNIQFDRTINVNDQFGLIGNDKLFTLLNDHGGFSFLLPNGNNGTGFLSGQNGQTDAQKNALQSPNQNTNNVVSPVTHQTPTFGGGGFGVGQGNLPGLQAARTQFSSGRLKSNATTNLSAGRPSGR